MQTHTVKSTNVSADDHSEKKRVDNAANLKFADNRPVVATQRKLQEAADESHQAENIAQLQAIAESGPVQENKPVQKKENKTGLPDNLKSGIENLSGHSLDDVKVHYNSSKPAQLQAHAYAQGTDIHLASGQEKHLPHEAWHVVQQKQGRVKPTRQLRGKVDVNDNAGLEREADIMGAKALQMKSSENEKSGSNSTLTQIGNLNTVQRVAIKDELEAGQYYVINKKGNEVIGQYYGTQIHKDTPNVHCFYDFYNPKKKHLVLHANDEADYIISKIVNTDEMNIPQGEGEVNKPMIKQSMLGTIYGVDVRSALQGKIADNSIGVVQGVFHAVSYNAPVDAWTIMQAPIGGGAAPAANPPGWGGGVHPNHHNRGHLIGNQFGGIGGITNLVTLTDGTNHPAMTNLENPLAAYVTANPGSVILYSVTPNYNAAFNQVTGAGATGGAGQVVIAHPAPASVTLNAVDLVTGAVLIGGVTINNGLLQNHAACND